MPYPELVKGLALGLMIGAIAPTCAEEHPVLVGMFVYMADAARLTDCRTGRSVPVAMEADYLRLERAYLDARQSPGQPLMVTFEGGIEGRANRLAAEPDDPPVGVDERRIGQVALAGFCRPDMDEPGDDRRRFRSRAVAARPRRRGAGNRTSCSAPASRRTGRGTSRGSGRRSGATP